MEYPYLEWFSEKNGRVVLELDDSQVTVVDDGIPQMEKTPEELLEDERKRAQAMVQFLGKLLIVSLSPCLLLQRAPIHASVLSTAALMPQMDARSG